jgi:hypothetical protein
MTATMIANDEVINLLNEIQRVRDYKDDIIKQEKYLMQRLHNIVNEHERFIIVDEHGIEKEIGTWKYAKDTERFDSKALKESNPSIYQLYVKISPGARTLKVKK